MTNTTLKQKSKQVDFQKEYEDIIKKAEEFTKFTFYLQSPLFNTQETFKKFSMYNDCPNSITSFNTDAIL